MRITSLLHGSGFERVRCDRFYGTWPNRVFLTCCNDDAATLGCVRGRYDGTRWQALGDGTDTFAKFAGEFSEWSGKRFLANGETSLGASEPAFFVINSESESILTTLPDPSPNTPIRTAPRSLPPRSMRPSSVLHSRCWSRAHQGSSCRSLQTLPRAKNSWKPSPKAWLSRLPSSFATAPSVD